MAKLSRAEQELLDNMDKQREFAAGRKRVRICPVKQHSYVDCAMKWLLIDAYVCSPDCCKERGHKEAQGQGEATWAKTPGTRSC